MGMYDSLTINKNHLPINEELRDKILRGEVYQTKSLDNSLNHYIITNNGKLRIHKGEWKDDGTFRTIAGIKFPNKKLVKKWTEKVDYTGSVIFYTDLDYLDNSKSYNPNNWIEFEATFINGKMISIRKLRDEEID